MKCCCSTPCAVCCKQLIAGGLAAGVFISFVAWLTHAVILMPRYVALTKMGFYHSAPALPYMPLSIAQNFLLGFLLAWLYAVSRDTLKPGPMAAIKVGFAVALIAGIPANLAQAAWSLTGKFIPAVSFVEVLVECIFGTLIAAALHRPKAAACCEKPAGETTT